MATFALFYELNIISLLRSFFFSLLSFVKRQNNNRKYVENESKNENERLHHQNGLVLCVLYIYVAIRGRRAHVMDIFKLPEAMWLYLRSLCIISVCIFSFAHFFSLFRFCCYYYYCTCTHHGLNALRFGFSPYIIFFFSSLSPFCHSLLLALSIPLPWFC